MSDPKQDEFESPQKKKPKAAKTKKILVRKKSNLNNNDDLQSFVRKGSSTFEDNDDGWKKNNDGNEEVIVYTQQDIAQVEGEVMKEEEEKGSTSLMTPAIEHAMKMSQLQSQLHYQQDIKKLLESYNLDVCLPSLPEIRAAKKATEQASQNAYRKNLDDVQKQFCGFQKIPAEQLPEFQLSKRASTLTGTKYKQDWENDKDLIFFPATLTPAYDAATASQQNISDKIYKQDMIKLMPKATYNPTLTNFYKTMQDNLKIQSDTEYKKEYNQNKAHGYTPVAMTADMQRMKDLNFFLNWSSYSAYARKLWEKYHLVVPLPHVKKAIETAKMTSDKWYKADYFRDCIGKSGPADIIYYPELQQARIAAGNASNIKYVKEADEAKSHYTLTSELPEIIRAKSLSDLKDHKYKEQKPKMIAEFQGYQKMSPEHHPEVLKAAKASALNNTKAYKEDWDSEKQFVYFPAHITPEYEASNDVKKVQSDSEYKKDFETNKSNVHYVPSETERYKKLKDLENTTSEIKYKKDYEKNKGKNFSQIPETAEMILSKELRPVQSKKLYAENAQALCKDYNAGSDFQDLQHAVAAQQIASPHPYRKEYKEQLVGKGPHDPTIGYPEHDHHKKVGSYTKASEQLKNIDGFRHQYILPPDTPQLINAKTAQNICSDIEYQRQKREVIDKNRGYQTINSKEHPVVQQGIKSAEMNSDKAYKEDWEAEKQYVYYPVHITPGYEASSSVKKVQSDSSYKDKYEKSKEKNQFLLTETNQYKTFGETGKLTDVKYKEKYEKDRGKNFTEVPETGEMVLSKQLRPVQSKKLYSEKSKEMQKNVSVEAGRQEVSKAISAQKHASRHPYKQEYMKKVLGKGPENPAIGYPEYDHLRKVAAQASSNEYIKDGKKAMRDHHLPVDAHQFAKAKEVAKNLSDIEYQKQRQETIDKYRGFQTMNSNDHPIVQQGIKAAELRNVKAYKEDWDSEKQFVYFPAHITPEYEASNDVKKVQSDTSYKKEFEKDKSKSNFNVTDTQQYNAIKEGEKTSNVKYKENYKKELGKNFTEIPETSEMSLSKKLRPIQSKKLYAEKSKQMQKNVLVGADLQEVSHAVTSQKLASRNDYKEKYKKEVLGKPPADPAKSYPEYEQLQKASNMMSKSAYQKDAARMMNLYNLPADHPELVRAREAAKNASDNQYQKQRKAVIDKYRGYQTMNSKDHPVVERGIKAAEILSDKLYKEDWESDKDMIFYPVHITPGYEQALDASKLRSDALYKKEASTSKQTNQYRPTDTSEYEAAKNLIQLISGNKYKQEYMDSRGKSLHSVPETDEMILSKQLRPILSNKAYAENARSTMQKYNLDSSTQGIQHALGTQKLSSDNEYVRSFKTDVLGKPRSNVDKSYPEYDLARKATQMASKTNYIKDADKMMHQHNLPLDYPEFVRAKQNAINASDAEYQKQRQQVIDKYRGFQTMNSKDHPIVKQGIKAAELVSDKIYKEDWEADKSLIYFPAHITPGYEAVLDANKAKSDVAYKKDYEDTKGENKFNVADTEQYKVNQDIKDLTSDKTYRKDYEDTKGKNRVQVEETPEMIISKSLRPLLSHKIYGDDAKKKMQEYNLDTSMQGIYQALSSQKIASDLPYRNDFRTKIRGRAPSDLVNSYPEYKHARNVSKLISKPLYVEEAEKMLHSHNLPLDYPEFVRAKENAKNASDVEYTKQRQQVIDKYRGFQTMNSKDHPIVQHGIKAAELVSDKLYKEDWESDKDMIFYPVHITPGYEQALDASKLRSDALYKKEASTSKQTNQYRPTDTSEYEAAKNLIQLTSGNKYKQEYMDSRGKNLHSVPETDEMILSKQLRPILSNKAYAENARSTMQKYNLDSSTQGIQHALGTQKLSSDNEYVRSFKTDVLGKPRSNVDKSYPEYDLARKATQMASKTNYIKDADKMMHQHNLPLDYPEFVRAKQNAINASDAEYQKQRQQVIDKYRGFQTMNSKDHPIVKQGIKAAELVSDKIYKEDWEADKSLIYFPAHITPGYEAVLDANKAKSDVAYKKDYEDTKGENKFNVADTEQYKVNQDIKDLTSNKIYRKDYEDTKGKNRVQVEETPEMIISKSLRPLLSHKIYGDDAKRKMQEYNLDTSTQGIYQALSSQKIASDLLYRNHFRTKIRGRAPSDLVNSYPEYKHARNVSKLISKPLYVEEAEKMLHTHNLPLDYPEFVRAKENAKNASDAEYTKQRQQVIDKYRGFQTMNSKDHPIVQQGIKAAELVSDKLYKEDWESDKDMIFYPVHITPGYEQALDASKLRSDALYKKEAAIAKKTNRYQPTETNEYETAKNLLELVSGNKYKQEYMDSRGKSLYSVPETDEMILSKQLRPILSNKAYAENARSAMQKYNLDSSTQGIQHALGTQKLSSDNEYVRSFKTDVLGKPRSNVDKSYPEYDLARKATQMASKTNYIKDADKMMHQHNLPLDYPEFVRAKQNAINASDAEYQKQRQQVIDKYRGFQTMNSKDHPIVKQGIKAAELVSDKIYKEDWEADKSLIYFPAHITPGYEAVLDANKAKSDVAYKKDYEDTKGENKFNVADTEQYKVNQDIKDLTSDKVYRKEYEETKGKNRVQVEETPEMIISKSLRPLLSHKIYGDDAKRKMKEYNLDTSMQGIYQALSSQKIASDLPYRNDFLTKIRGRAPSDLVNSYPEYKHARNVSKLISKPLYVEEAEKMLHTHNLPLDYPEFVRAKENAKNASDLNYKKQRQEVIDKYRGFQTMDSKDHPIVQHGIKAAELVSDKLYKEDWESDKNFIYYPVHITPGYEQALDASKFQSDALYKKEASITKQTNQYRPTETNEYETAKNLLELVSGNKYKQEYMDSRGKSLHSVPETDEMILSKQLRPILSNKAYAENARSTMQKYNLDSSTQGIQHALGTQKLSSDNEYVRSFKTDVLGKPRSNVDKSYPEYDLARKATQMASKTNYIKDADKMMHQHNLPLDYPEFVRAKQNAINASDAEYQKQRQQVIDKYRGFQTMNSKDHPIVKQGIKAAELVSDKIYKEDWEADKSLIYFPAHITPGYEAIVDANKAKSDVAYKKDYEDTKGENKFNVADTEQYKVNQDIKDLTSDKVYRKEYEETKGKNRVQVKETPEMIISKSLRPLLSHKIYGDDAKRKMKEYNLDTSMQGIYQALSSQKIASDLPYRNHFRTKIRGRAPSDLVNSYPEHEHARNVSKLISKPLYVEEAEKMLHTHNLPLDYPEFVRAKENAKNASDMMYKRQRKEVIDSYRGFQTMDSKDHPVVQHGIKAAELISDKKYKEEYMEDKDMIYYPVHLTAGYEAAIKSSENQSDACYKRKDANQRNKNNFNYVETELYKTQKDLNELRDVIYSGNYPRNFTSLADLPEMNISRFLNSVLSPSKYGNDAKKRLDVYNIDLQDQQMKQALLATKIISAPQYKQKFKNEIWGQAPRNLSIAYPESEHVREVSKMLSKANYVKEAEQLLHHNKLPLDYPEFIRAKMAAKNASDIEYQKQRQQVIDNYRGFQTMDSTEHPVVQQGIKVADIISQRKYIDDYLQDRSLIYYPVHLTPGYEAALKANEYQSEINYKSDYNKSKSRSKYDPTYTELYKVAKQASDNLNENLYRKPGKELLEKNFSPIETTSEMIIAKQLKDLQPAYYQQKAKDLIHKYHLNVELPEITHSMMVNQMVSRNNYLEEYNKTIKGNPPSDLTNSYPEYKHANRISKLTSKVEYTKDGDQIRHVYTLPVETPEFNCAKEATKNASDLLYKKQRQEVIDKYRGFQTMNSKDHPIVQHGIKAAELVSDKKYKEEYMEEKDMIYYPVHLTAGYEAAIKSNENQSDVCYKSKYEKEKEKNVYNMVNSDYYKNSKELAEHQKSYKDGLKVLSSALTSVPDSYSQKHMKFANSLLSNKAYTEQAKQLLDKYNLTTNMVQIAHALSATPLASDNAYHQDYIDVVKGKSRSGGGVDFYPDYIMSKKNTLLASKSDYTKENEKIIHHFTMPNDTPELKRAKESAINASDIAYQKQRKEVIDSYRGFQTMDSKQHPVVQHGIKAADLMSERKYKADYMEDRNLIYYPVHLTSGYEVAIKANQYVSGPKYKKDHLRDRNDFKFDVTDTELYKAIKQLDQLSDKNYKLEPGKLQYTQVADGPDMVRARTVKPLLSYWFYKDQAKKMLDKYHVDIADQKVVHALHASQLYSDNLYKEEYEKEIKGKHECKNIDSYPEHKQAIKAGKVASSVEYSKDKEKILKNYTISADTPAMKQAKIANEQASGIKYSKSKKDVIDNYRGFQTMNSKEHPVVQRGIKAADLISDKKYKEEYMTERGLIYYPVHLTQGYEVAMKSMKYISDADYKEWYKKNVIGTGHFQINLTPGYKQTQEVLSTISNKNYLKDYEDLKQSFSGFADKNEERCIKLVQPWLSKKLYGEEARNLMGKYHLDVEVPQIAHALLTNKMASNKKYIEDYENKLKGRGAKNLEDSPYFKHLAKTSKLASKINYGKQAKDQLQDYSLGLDANEIQQAMIAEKLVSDIDYRKSKADTLNKMQAYYKLNCDDLPAYKKHRNFAANFSDVLYKEDFNDMKKYVYFPYHVTSQYEKDVAARKNLSQKLYQEDYNANKIKQNFKYHEIPLYLNNKQLQELLSEPIRQKDLKELHMHGFTSTDHDPYVLHVAEIQKLLSDSIYRADAKKVLDKYNITAELCDIQHSMHANKLTSSNLYQKDAKKLKGHAMKFAPDIPAFSHARNVKDFTSDKFYKDKAKQSLSDYKVVADTPDIIQAKKASDNASVVKYKEKGKEAIGNIRGYQFLDANEQRDVVHARKVNDLISPAKYKEEYNEIRNIIYFPVHLTEGYETAIKANKFASPSEYKKGWLQNRFRNSFKVHETEGYKLDRAVQKIFSSIAYKSAYNESLGKCPYITDTPERKHHREIKNLNSEKLYKLDAHSIMDKYHLISDEPRMKVALQAMKQLSNNIYKEEYMNEKSKILFNPKDTPLMTHLKKIGKLASTIPYKQKALEDLQYFMLPENALSIKHAKETGHLASDLTYKSSKNKNLLEGYKKLLMKDNFLLSHLDKIKDVLSDTEYKREFNEQKGQLIPIVDSPESVRHQKQQKLQSNVVYQKDLDKFIKGRGLSTDQTPLIEHAKSMSKLSSETKYREGLKNQHHWQSGEATNTPVAVKAKEVTDLCSEVKYKEEYEQEKGQGCNVLTPAMSLAINANKTASENVYKEQFRSDSNLPPSYSVLPSTPFMEHVQEVGAKLSERKYKEEHEKEDIGYSAEMKESVQLLQDKLTTALQSHNEYTKQGKKEALLHKEYFYCLNETPRIKFAQKVRDILSDYKYREAYENEKGIYFYPYYVTPIYETQTKAGKQLSQKNYTKKALDEQHMFHLTTDQPNFKQAQNAMEILSEIKYRQPYQGKAAKIGNPEELPSSVFAKKMQDLFSHNKYKINYEQIKDKYHLDPAATSFVHALNASQLSSEKPYREAYNLSKGTPFNSYKDCVEMEHLRVLPDRLSDIKYKQDLIVSKGKLIQVDDTPWLSSFKAAQKRVSNIDYDQRSSNNLYQPHKFNKHVKNVTDSISDIKYHDDYKTYYKGNLIPIPATLEMEVLLRNSELFNKSAYRKKAKDGMQHYLIIPDDPEFKRLKEAATYLSNIAYKEEAAKEQLNFTPVPETPTLKKAKETQELQSQNAYTKKSKERLATEFNLPPEGTTTMQQQHYASTLASDNMYKQKGEEILHDPTAFKTMKETRDTTQAKKVSASISDIKYKAKAKKNFSQIHPVVEDPWMKKATEANMNISDIRYKAKDKDMHHKYKLRGIDNFHRHAISVRDKISDVKYKADYIDNIGLCWCLPDEAGFQHARKMLDLYSDNKYKQEARKLKGKYHITTDSPEFERFRKVQDEISDKKYKEELPKRMKEFTVLECTPEIKHATVVSDWVSPNKYKDKLSENLGKFTVLEKDPKVEHAQKVNKLASKNAYEKNYKEIQKDNFTTIADRCDTEQQKIAQKIASNVQYKKSAKAGIDKDFTVLETRPDIEHAVNTGKIQSNVNYKQKIEGKNLDTMKTPSMKQAIDANKLQSEVEYRKTFQKEMKGKRWKFVKDSPVQKHIENINKVQSQYKYTKQHRDNVGKGYTSVTDRPDILHAASCKDMISDYEYKRRHRDMSGKGYTFVPDNPTQLHVEEAGCAQSELQYRKKYSNKGKSWLVEESPALDHSMEAQKLVGNIDYKKDAKVINSRGTSAAMEFSPVALQQKKAQEILNDKLYKSDFEKTVKGRGMTFDLHGTPAMDQIKKAEGIKSDVKYKEKYQANLGHTNYNINTPEFARVKANQRFVSQVHYKADANEMKGKQTAALLDTPEMRLVRQNTQNFSNLKYKQSAAKNQAISSLDTPELRTVRQNTKNFSQVKYQEDRNSMKGKAIAVIEDMTMQRVRQATINASDVAYKGLKNKINEMEDKREFVVNQTTDTPTTRTTHTKKKSSRTLNNANIIKCEQVRRWNRNPGSIFDYDPSDYNSHEEYEQGRASVEKRQYLNQQISLHSDDSDFVQFTTYDPQAIKSSHLPWTSFVKGNSFRQVSAPNSMFNRDFDIKHRSLGGISVLKKQYKALFGYEAAEDNEVGFCEGDLIINAQPIDDGWMFGTCIRTGKTGMLPSNYVQLVA